jgi:tRNA(Ile)-lysidine synthetase-like protein
MTRDPLALTVLAFLEAHAIADAGTTLLVAVSGGPDSLCLLHVLAQLQPQRGFRLHVAHLDHRLRGEESARDAAFVAGVARAWGLAATVEALDVAALAAERRMNVYAAGRAARYELLTRTALAIGASAVAVAHTASDQAETVLMHLLRGAGPEGLAGMQARVPWQEWAVDVPEGLPGGAALVRPLLGVTREQVAAYCARHGLVARVDPSNADTRHTRSRIRHELLPLLIEYNPRILDALSRTAELSADAQGALEEQLDTHWPALVVPYPGGLAIDGQRWRSLSAALQRAALRRAYRLLGGQRTLSHERVEAARRATHATGEGPGRTIQLPEGISVAVGYAGQFTIGASPPADGPQLTDAGATIAIGTTPLELALRAGWSLSVTAAEQAHAAASAWEIWLDRALLEQPLVVRGRQPGDRMRPAGGAGTRRLQDILVDRRVPRALRDAWPVLAAGPRIVWVAGLTYDAGALAQPGSPALHVRISRPGSSSGSLQKW